MMENKPRLVINRGVLIGEKSPPTKLLLNHGKPNFTIVKSPKLKCNLLPEEKIFFVGDLKPSDLRKRPAKSLHQNGTTNGSASTDEEFMRLHKKIGGKNIDEDCTDSNSNVAFYKINLPKDQHFATLQRNCILTVKSVANSNDTIVVTDTVQTNGKVEVLPEKPPARGKPENLKVLQRRSPSPAHQQKPSYNQSGPQLPPTTNAGVVNFEQRPVVSFAKDLAVMPNRYPDTVKISKTAEISLLAKSLPKEFSDLKFDIASNGDVMMPIKQSLAL